MPKRACVPSSRSAQRPGVVARRRLRSTTRSGNLRGRAYQRENGHMPKVAKGVVTDRRRRRRSRGDVPYQRLLEEGYEVDVAAPTVKTLQFVVHDFVDGFDTYTEKPGHTWPADVAFADVDPADYVAVVIPGGRAPEYIRNDPDAQRIVRHFMEGDLP